MIKHVVLFAFKTSITEQDANAILQAIADLQKVIPQIVSFSGGNNMSIENKDRGYMHGFVMEFRNKADRDTYVFHPEHKKIVQEKILPALTEQGAIVFDYEG